MSYITTTTSLTTSLVSSEDGKHTYSITKALDGCDGDKAVIVLMYPTRNAENIGSDDTTLTHIIAHMRDMDLKEVTIINLFSTVVRAKLSAKGLNVDHDNLDYIEKEIMSRKDFKDTKFIAAWGSSMENCKACQDTKQMLVSLFRKHNPKGIIYQLAVPSMPSENCPHPLWFGIRAKFEKWYLTECKALSAVTEEKDKDRKNSKTAKAREFVVLSSTKN